ncbi:hypothetical protein N0V84_001835 [Fusarium piperis]|uniref:Uncharacterized protein n=1 Tax=Fusarium piperis TaxID=1435070 RepID=A0A9W8WKG5_9HYPO|nr:hypothetical protein N0V84_001835 [Fusarium piperis]
MASPNTENTQVGEGDRSADQPEGSSKNANQSLTINVAQNGQLVPDKTQPVLDSSTAATSKNSEEASLYLIRSCTHFSVPTAPPRSTLKSCAGSFSKKATRTDNLAMPNPKHAAPDRVRSTGGDLYGGALNRVDPLGASYKSLAGDRTVPFGAYKLGGR